MAETVLVSIVIAVMLLLVFAMGWNFRRFNQITNMDRYAVWERATPGAPGPDTQGLSSTMRNPRFNEAFFGHSNDKSDILDEHRSRTYMPEGHEMLRDQLVDETYSYYEEFLDQNPRGIRERFSAEHSSFSLNYTGDDSPLAFDNSQAAKTEVGGSYRMQGDWRYVNGVRYNSGANKWEPAYQRVSPGDSLREVFYAEMDDMLEPYDNRGNKLARAIREFYLSYPGYEGPEVDDEDLDEEEPTFDDDEGGYG